MIRFALVHRASCATLADYPGYTLTMSEETPHDTLTMYNESAHDTLTMYNESAMILW